MFVKLSLGDSFIVKKVIFRNLLIVDDYASTYLSKLITVDLKVAAEVLAFQRTQEALAYFRTHCMDEKAARVDCPDLILLDVHMPIMDGEEFIQELKSYSLAHLFTKAIVILTISDPQPEKAKLQAYGILGFIIKPLAEVKLVNLLNEQIRFL